MNFTLLPFLFIPFSKFQLLGSPLTEKFLTQKKLVTFEGGGDEKLIFITWYRMLMFRQLSLGGIPIHI